MAISASVIIARANFVLQDDLAERWTTAERIEWINEGCKAIITRKPEAGSQTVFLTLVSGSRQLLDDDVFKLMSIVRNVDASNNPLKSVSRTDQATLDLADPDWHNTTPAITRQWMYSETISPSEYFVYPPAIAGKLLQAVVSKFPTPITATTDTIGLTPEYEEALLNYVLYRCFSKDSEYGDGSTATAFYSAFQTALGQSQ